MISVPYIYQTCAEPGRGYHRLCPPAQAASTRPSTATGSQDPGSVKVLSNYICYCYFLCSEKKHKISWSSDGVT